MNETKPEVGSIVSEQEWAALLDRILSGDWVAMGIDKCDHPEGEKCPGHEVLVTTNVHHSSALAIVRMAETGLEEMEEGE